MYIFALAFVFLLAVQQIGKIDCHVDKPGQQLQLQQSILEGGRMSKLHEEYIVDAEECVEYVDSLSFQFS